MFSSNNYISGRQLNRLIVVDFLGIIGLLMPQIVLYFCLQDGLIAIFYAIFISLIYTYLILKIKSKIKGNLIDYINKKAGRLCAIFVGLFFAIKYFIFALVGLYILANIVYTVLLPEVNPILVIGVMIIVASYSVVKGIEARARMAEILYYIVLIPIILILIFSFKQIDKYNITPLFIQSQATIIKTALIVVLLFSPSEILLFSDDIFDNNKKTRRSIYYGIITVGIINLLIFTVNVGIFGVNGMLKEEWPTITLMQVVEISGMFLERQDGIMSIFYIVSLFSVISAFIYYIVIIIKSMFKVESNRRYGWIAVLMLFIAVSIFMNGDYVWNIKSSASSRVEIEERAYVMALGVDKLNEKISITYSFPDVTAQTGQEAKEENKETFNCSVDNIYEAENIYMRQADKKLDFSQIKVIIIGVQLLEDKEALEQIISYFKDNSEFARSTILCAGLDGANTIIALDSSVSGSIGDYLQKMFANNIIGCTSSIGDLISNQADNKTINTIPVLEVQQGFPNFIESVIMKGLNVIKYCDLEDTAYFNIIDGEGDGSIINLEPYGDYQIINNDVNSKVRIIADRTVHLTITLSGTLESRNATNENPDLSVINDAIEEVLLGKILTLQKENNIDYMETHKLLGIYDKDLWVKYLNKDQELFDNLYIEIDSNYILK